MISCSLIILFKMKQTKNRVKCQQTLEKSCKKTQKHHFISKNIQFILTTLSLNLTFLLFNLPISVHQLMFYYFHEDNDQADSYFLYISVILFYFHFSLSFPTHYIFNSCFRSEIKRVISMIKERKFFSFHNKTDTVEKNKLKLGTLSVISTGKLP